MTLIMLPLIKIFTDYQSEAIALVLKLQAVQSEISFVRTNYITTAKHYRSFRFSLAIVV